MLGLERLQAAIRISLGNRDAAPRPRALQLLEKLLGAGEPLPRIAPQATVHRGDEPRVQIGDQRSERRRIPFGRHVTEEMGRDVVEGTSSGAQLEDHGAEGIQIGADRQVLAAPGLGGDVERSSDQRPFRLVLHGGGGQEQARQSEIDDLDLPLVGDEDVRGVQVAVQDAAAVGGGEPAREVAGDLEDAREGHGPLDRSQGAALNVFGNEIGPLADATHAIEGGDVGVLDARRGPRLDEEMLERSAIRRVDELHRYQPVEKGVLREVDAAFAFAQRPQEPVLVELDGGNRHAFRERRMPAFRCRQFHGARSG